MLKEKSLEEVVKQCFQVEVDVQFAKKASSEKKKNVFHVQNIAKHAIQKDVKFVQMNIGFLKETRVAIHFQHWNIAKTNNKMDVQNVKKDSLFQTKCVQNVQNTLNIVSCVKQNNAHNVKMNFFFHLHFAHILKTFQNANQQMERNAQNVHFGTNQTHKEQDVKNKLFGR